MKNVHLHENSILHTKMRAERRKKTSLYYHHHKNKELEKEVIKIYALGPMLLLTMPHCE